jgi:hypothetical protein
MCIVHGTFHLESQLFRLWGEADQLSACKAGRRTKIPPHPFAVAADQLKDWVSDPILHAQPEMKSFTLWLPSTKNQPQASPEMRASGVFSDNAPLLWEVQPWQVEGVGLTIPDTIDLMMALAQRGDTGRSLHFWRAAVLEALALVIRQQVTPALEKDGFHYRAFWQPFSEQPELLTELAS